MAGRYGKKSRYGRKKPRMFRKKRYTARRRYGGKVRSMGKPCWIREGKIHTTITGGAAAQNLNPAITMAAAAGNHINAFLELYDFVYIKKFVLVLEPAWTDAQSITGGDRYIRVVHDYSGDASNFTTETDYLEHASCKSYSIVRNKPIRLTVYPKVLQNFTPIGGAVSGGKLANPGWIDNYGLAGNPSSITFNHLYIYVPAVMSAQTTLFKTRLEAVLGFKGQN